MSFIDTGTSTSWPSRIPMIPSTWCPDELAVAHPYDSLDLVSRPGETAEVGIDWQAAFLESCCDASAGSAAVGEGAFAPGPAVWVGRREIAHFDDERVLDVRLTKAEIRSRRDELESDERVALRRGSSDWVAILIGADDEEWARGIVVDAVTANLRTAPPGLPPTGRELEQRRRFH